MGKLKQLHIDCMPGECLAGTPDVCFAQQDDEDIDPLEPSTDNNEADFNSNTDIDRE